jgi:putative hydrolase of the HAD superfamily
MTAKPQARQTGPGIPGATPPTRAVLFDLDDTLVDHLHACRCALAAIQAETGWFGGVSPDELEIAYREVLTSMHADVVRGVVDREEARAERLRRFGARCGQALSGEDVRRARAIYYAAYRQARRLVPGARELLAALHGRVQIGVVTDHVVAEQVEKLESFGLAPLVDTLVASGEVGVSKPDARLFRVALERLGCAAGAAVMVGDSWERDVVGATALGIRAVWLNRYAAPCPDPALATEVRSLEPAAELVPLLLGVSGPVARPRTQPAGRDGT